MATEFDSRLDALRARFAERCGGHAAELDEWVARAGTAPDDSREAIRAVAHRLAGTAGTFGFAEIGEIAGRLEHLCEDSSRLEAVAAACAELQAALLAVGWDATGKAPA